MSDVPVEAEKKQPSTYEVLLLVAGEKIAFLQRVTDPMPPGSWDNPEWRSKGIVLPTSTPEIGHCVRVFQASMGEDTRMYFGPVDTWRDLSLSLYDTVAKLKGKGWEKCELDHALMQMRDTYLRKLFP